MVYYLAMILLLLTLGFGGQDSTGVNFERYADRSSLIVIADFKERLPVVREESVRNSVTTLPNGAKEIRMVNPQGYVYFLRVRDVLKSSKESVKAGSVIRVFVADPGLHSPILLGSIPFLLLLEPVGEDAAEYAGSIVWRTSEPVEKQERFDRTQYFQVVAGDEGAYKYRGEIIRAVDELKKKLKSRPQ